MFWSSLATINAKCSAMNAGQDFIGLDMPGEPGEGSPPDGIPELAAVGGGAAGPAGGPGVPTPDASVAADGRPRS